MLWIYARGAMVFGEIREEVGDKTFQGYEPLFGGVYL